VSRNAQAAGEAVRRAKRQNPEHEIATDEVGQNATDRTVASAHDDQALSAVARFSQKLADARGIAAREHGIEVDAAILEQPSRFCEAALTGAATAIYDQRSTSRRDDLALEARLAFVRCVRLSNAPVTCRNIG
jgi:hypothetical protein